MSVESYKCCVKTGCTGASSRSRCLSISQLRSLYAAEGQLKASEAQTDERTRAKGTKQEDVLRSSKCTERIILLSGLLKPSPL